MTTTTLSSKGRFKNLLLGMLKKNLSIAAYLTAIFFFFFPLQLLLDTLHLAARLARQGEKFVNYSGTILGVYTDIALVAVTVLMVLAPIVVGLMQCSFLHSKRAVDLYHSLPVTRVQLLGANLLAAFLTVTIPFLFNYLINLLVALYRHSALGAAAEQLVFSQICWDLFGWFTMVFAILAIILMVATQVGSVFENFVFVCELLCAPLLMILINDTLCQLFLVGYVTPWTDRFLAASTPVGVVIGRYVNGGEDALFYNWVGAVWLLLGTAIFTVAQLLYRRRKSELAETPGCRGVVGMVLTAMAVYIGGLALGGMLWSIASENRSQWVFLFWAAVGAVLVYLLVAAILNRGFGGLRKMLPQGVKICVLVLISAALVVVGGGFGYETRCPAVASVKNVTISYRGWYRYVVELDAASQMKDSYAQDPQFTRYRYAPLEKVVLSSPEAVQQLRTIHQMLVADARAKGAAPYSGNWELTYQLKSGKLLRRYSGYSDATQQCIRELEELPEFQQQTNPLLLLNPEQVEQIKLYDSLGFPVDTLDTPEQRKLVLEALRQDALANGTRDFTNNAPVRGYLYLNTGEAAPYQELSQPLEKNHVVSFSLPVFESYTHLAAALQSLGKAEMLRPADPDAITAVGVDYYYSDYTDGRVASVQDEMPQRTVKQLAEAHLALVTVDHATTRQLLAVAQRFLEQEVFHKELLYITLYRGEERGLTLPLEAEKLPQAVAQQLPPDPKNYYFPSNTELQSKG